MKFHSPEEIGSEKDSTNDSLLANGHDFEKTARQLLAPHGVDITAELPHLDFDNYVRATKRELEKKNAILYQATFQTRNERIIADVVKKKKDEIELIEIKATTKIQEHHIYDIAYQYYCIQKAGFKISKAFLAIVNTDYVREGEISKDLVKLTDVTTKIKHILNIIPHRLRYFKGLLRSKEGPEPKIGFHCVDPHPCPFKESCWKKLLPENNVFDIRGLRVKDKMHLYWAGIVDFKDILKRNIRLTHGQKTQVSCGVKNQTIFEKEKIASWLERVDETKGAYFFDFETIALATPAFNGDAPYEQVPFQYSLHLQVGTKISHFEFLADPMLKEDYRRLLISQLVSELNKNPALPIITFNKSFENGRLTYLARVFTEFEKDIIRLKERVIDLADCFREKFYYSPELKGGYSIKNVLPHLCPELTYNVLQIRNGSQASAEFLRMKTAPDKDEIASALKEYCKLDTYALIRILAALRHKVKTEENSFKWKRTKKLKYTA